MSIGTEMAFRRSARGKDATGSLLFDAERKRVKSENADDDRNTVDQRAEEKAHIG